MAKYSIITFLKNIRYLFMCSLKEMEREAAYMALSRVEDVYKYEILDANDVKSESLHILTPEESLDLILSSPKSFVRFGDGEINIINGKSISFQKYDEKLAQIMLEILEKNVEDLYVGINYTYFHTSRHMNEYNRKFYLIDVKSHREFLLKHCNPKRTYIAAAFNQMYIVSRDNDLSDYYKTIKKMFKGRDLVIFAGKGILDNIENDVFEEANSKEFVWGPSKNAFDYYEEIYEQACSYSKDKTLCFILGPASKALVYRLSQEGYMAWDIGHMAKDYEFFCKKRNSDKDVKEFYAPG